MGTLADRINEFNRLLDFKGELPEGIRIMNPFREDDRILEVASSFYRKFYNDNHSRHLILGINPGRFGAGVTGIPFTDTKRLTHECGLKYTGRETHETSSVFVYEVIEAYGGVEKFYHDFYINSICPLGFTVDDGKGKEKNYNYYDSKALTGKVFQFMVGNIKTQIALGMETDICFCFGTGKNEKFLRTLNEEYGFFKNIIALEHPRYIMQYKAKFKADYIDKYLNAFCQIH
ncbi:MAG: DUF4918 family protein [Bacteroidota bacterium]|nr:DUF4918 family protein [Bacteroidota bacterium]